VVAALQVDQRVERAAQAMGYLAINVPIALLGLLAVIGLIVGAALSMVGIGLPILLGAAAACRSLLSADRWAANRLLDAHIQSLPPAPRTSGTPWRRSLRVLSDRGLWRVVAALAARPLLIAALLAMALAPVVLLAFIGGLGVQGVIGTGDLDYFGPWTFGVGMGLVLCLFALPAAVLAIAALDAMRTLLCTITRALLGPRTVASGPVREILADSLGDRSVSVAYWLPDREVFVDEAGRPVDLPDPGTGRTWTAVERDGRRVAAIVHDAALDTSRELVQAAADASSLAIDNERLKADLRARLEELRVSRLRIVEATDNARRRIERDLHDGAQQHLVSLALDLRILRSRVNDDPDTLALVDALSERLTIALDELRELARGIHPAVLTERGLGPAIEALVERAVVPVDCDIRLDERLPERVEAAAYFTVAEAITNVGKYANATRADVRVHLEGDELFVRVSDDGVGGADLGRGTGLRGLEDRLAAVGGTLILDSPEGGGTRLIAALPAGMRAAAEEAEELA
jgi:signal transduction histidine kinase